MARKCEEDIVPETKPSFGECKSNSNSSSNGSSGNNAAAIAATVKAAGGVGGGAPSPSSAAHLLPKTVDRILRAVSPKLDDDADDILSMSLNKIDSPPPPRPCSRTTKGSSASASGGVTTAVGRDNSNSSSSSSGSNGGVEDLVRRKSNALSKVQSKSDSPLDGASVGSASGGGGGAGGGGNAGKSASSTAAAADMDGVDLCSTDEVKVFKDEGDRDDEKMSVEHNLLEEKSSLIDFTENEGKLLKAHHPRYHHHHHVSAEDPHPARSKIPIEDKRGEATLSSVLASHHAAAAAANPFNMGYPFVSPYPTYSNGDPISMPMANKIGIPPFFCYSTNSSEPSHSLSVATHHLTTPPPAHCGIPPYQLDAKGIAGLSGRGSSAAAAAALYAFGPPNPHQYHPSPYAMLGADLSNNWQAPSVYSSMVAAAASAGFRNSSYPPPPHDFSSFRFSHLISPQSSAATAAAASAAAASAAASAAAAASLASHSAHHGYTGQFSHQLPPSYSLAGLTSSTSPSLVNSGPKQSVSSSSSKSNKYFPSIPSLGDQGSSHSPTGGQQQQPKNGGSSSDRAKDKMMSSSAGSPYGRDSSGMKGSKQQQQQHVLDNTSIGLQGLSKVEVGADLSSSGANRLNSSLLYQPYDAISKELSGLGGGPGMHHPGDKGSNSMGGSGLMGSSGPGSMMSDDQQPREPTSRRAPSKQKPHIKKPLNAFMLYMKDMRANVVAECTLKESAAINQILGRRWHSLSREEQSKYYEKARMERQLHMELYPGWSARDNYGYGSKKKKRKKDRGSPSDISSGNNMKKCRARYGLDQQNQWCKPCRRKKKCIKYMEMLMMSGGGGAGGNGGGSLSGTMSPDFGNEFDNHNEDDEDDDDDGSGDDSDEHMDDMDDDMMPPSNEMGGGGAGGGSGVGGGSSGGPNGGPSPFLMQGPRSNDPDQQADKIFGNPAAQACAVGVATIKQERDYGKGYDDHSSLHPGGSVAAYNAMLADHHNSQLHHHSNSLLGHPGHMLNGGSSSSNPSSPASMLLHHHQQQLLQHHQQQQQVQQQQPSSNGISSHSHHPVPSATTTVGPHSQDDKHGLHMYPFQGKHQQAGVCFPPSPAASSSSSLTAPLSNNPKMNSSHSLWLASSPMLMTPATLSGSDQSPQRQTPEETKTKNGGMYGDHHGGPSSVEPMPQQQKKKKRRRKRKHSSKGGVSGARNGGGGSSSSGSNSSGMSKSIQHILLRAIFEGNSGQVTSGDKENVIEFIEHFFRTRHSNHRMRQLIQARMNSSSSSSAVESNRHHSTNNKGSRHSDSDGGETDSSSCTDEDDEIVGCPRSSSKLPFTISSIIG